MRRLPAAEELAIETLGTPERLSPLSGRGRFVDDGERVLLPSTAAQLAAAPPGAVPAFERAGPRRRIFFDPAAIGCGLVTCGGLCPGLNNVIRAVVLSLHHLYGVRRVIGFRYGYAGLAADPPREPMELTPPLVESLHEHGGTILGSSRGPQSVSEMVDTLERERISILFTLGGDGTLKGAAALVAEIRRRGLPIAVVGIPKTIDNDLAWIERSFGFATAVEEATAAIMSAHAEARGAWNGVGLVKLMGRYSGFITAHATLSSADVNFCLVPEVPFTLEGEGGFLEALEARLRDRRHAVIALAEGAGQELMKKPGEEERDASGNLKLHDVGPFLKQRIRGYFEQRGMPVSVKYIDPSYLIRSLPANSLDAEYCLMLGQHAVHAAMAGKTGMMVGSWNDHYTHVPLALATGRRKALDPDGEIWPRVLGTTGQPASMVGR